MIPKPWVVFVITITMAIFGISPVMNVSSPMMAKIGIYLNENLRNETLEIKRVEAFATEIDYLKTQFLMKIGVIEENERNRLCENLDKSLMSAKDTLFKGGSRKRLGITYTVQGIDNLDVSKWVVGDKIVKGHVTKNILMEHQRERRAYTDVLVYDSSLFVHFCEKYDERLENFINKNEFESIFFDQVIEPIVCINNITADSAWESCPMAPFSKGQEWARKIYQKAEELVKKSFGNHFEISCHNRLDTLFGEKWTIFQADMALRAKDNKRGTNGRMPCSILDISS